MQISSLLENWIGVLITGIVSFAAAWVLRGIDKNQKFKDKKLDHSQKIISNLSCYIENWRRLLAISNHSEDKTLSEQENERLCRYVNDRDNAKSDLMACINMLPLFFDDNVVTEFNEFRKWDNAQSTLRVSELPIIDEWEKWQYKLCTLLKKENLS